MTKRVVLAYSGGLDTSIILKWLTVKFGYEVIAVYLNAGQKEDIPKIKRKALDTGAKKFYAINITKEFIEDYVYPCLKMNAVYEGEYLLGTSMARPLMAKKLVEVAVKESAGFICHGATGKGNDQVRFESAIHALDPRIKIIAPWRFWEFKSREDLIDFAKKHKIKIDQSKKKIYSRDENIWHISHEGGNLEDPWNEHEDGVHVLSVPVEKAPNTSKTITIDFEKGVPKSINGKKMTSIEALTMLNKLASKHGIGTIDIVENRLIGMKSRGVYETPGGTILYKAHQALEKLVLDRDTMREKNQMSVKYAEIVYDGKWFTPIREAMDAFCEKTQEVVTGTVKIKLYKGQAIPVAMKSKYSLYNEEFATFSEDEVFDQSDAEGFINLFSLSMKIRAIMKRKKSTSKNKKNTGSGGMWIE